MISHNNRTSKLSSKVKYLEDMENDQNLLRNPKDYRKANV